MTGPVLMLIGIALMLLGYLTNTVWLAWLCTAFVVIGGAVTFINAGCDHE